MMTMTISAPRVLGSLVAGAILSTVAGFGQVPERSLGGQTLEVPDEQMEAGEVYFVRPGEGPQIFLVSDALLQRLTVTTERLVGYVVAPFDLEEVGTSPVLSGAFRIPVASWETGLDDTFNTPGGGDEILQSSEFMDRDRYPEMLVEITRVAEFTQTHHDEVSTHYEAELEAKLTVKGNVRDLTIPATLTFMPSTFRTMARLDGDLLFLESSFPVNLKQLGWEVPSSDWADRISDELEVSIYLSMSTVSPDRSIDPRLDPTNYAKRLRFLTLLRDLKDPEAGYEFGYAFMKEIWDQQEELGRLAHATLSSPGIARRDLRFALKAAERANELAEEQDVRILETLARVHYGMGNLDQALHWQKKAVSQLDGEEDRLAERVKTELARYEKEAQRE